VELANSLGDSWPDTVYCLALGIAAINHDERRYKAVFGDLDHVGSHTAILIFGLCCRGAAEDTESTALYCFPNFTEEPPVLSGFPVLGDHHSDYEYELTLCSLTESSLTWNHTMVIVMGGQYRHRSLVGILVPPAGVHVDTIRMPI